MIHFKLIIINPNLTLSVKIDTCNLEAIRL